MRGSIVPIAPDRASYVRERRQTSRLRDSPNSRHSSSSTSSSTSTTTSSSLARRRGEHRERGQERGHKLELCEGPASRKSLRVIYQLMVQCIRSASPPPVCPLSLPRQVPPHPHLSRVRAATAHPDVWAGDGGTGLWMICLLVLVESAGVKPRQCVDV